MMGENNTVTLAKTTAKKTTTTMDMMEIFMRRQQARHKAARKFALGVVSDVGVPSVFLNDNINNVEVPVVMTNKKTVVLNNKNG